MQNTTAYVDVFVDDFLEISQGPSHRQQHIWEYLVPRNGQYVSNPVLRLIVQPKASLMPQEYRYMGLHLVHLSFSTVMDNGHSKQDTVPSTTPRNRIWEILSSIIRTDNQMSVNKWHWVLGKMLSISVDLPVS